MKKTIHIILISICIGIAIFIAGKRAAERRTNERKEQEQVLLVEKYLKQEYDIDCKVIKTDFRHYNEGIMGGLFIYGFTCKDQEGNIFEATYQSYFDLMDSSVGSIEIKR